MKVWTTNDFEGHWPVGTAAVIVAEDEDQARELLAAALREHGLKDSGFTLWGLPVHIADVRVLADGNY